LAAVRNIHTTFREYHSIAGLLPAGCSGPALGTYGAIQASKVEANNSWYWGEEP